MRHQASLVLLGVALAIVTALAVRTPATAQPAGTTSAPAELDMTDAERAFQSLLDGAEMIGSYTMELPDAPKADTPAQAADRYVIHGIRKIGPQLWQIDAGMRYNGRDIRLPIPVPVHFADDTPVICVTRLGLPGMGTYSARVMFFADRYVGVWRADATGIGGTMTGRVIRPMQTSQPASAPAQQG